MLKNENGTGRNIICSLICAGAAQIICAFLTLAASLILSFMRDPLLLIPPAGAVIMYLSHTAGGFAAHRTTGSLLYSVISGAISLFTALILSAIFSSAGSEGTAGGIISHLGIIASSLLGGGASAMTAKRRNRKRSRRRKRR